MCTVKGERGNGTSRGTCPEKQVCQANGECKKGCTVLGKPGTGIDRGDCPEDMICFATGDCRQGKL